MRLDLSRLGSFRNFDPPLSRDEEAALANALAQPPPAVLVRRRPRRDPDDRTPAWMDPVGDGPLSSDPDIAGLHGTAADE